METIEKSHNVSVSTEIPLSMRFLHKPRRSEELYIKSNDQTQANSKLNARPIRIDDSSDPSPTSLDYFNLDGGITNTKNGTPPVFSPEELSDYKLVRKKSGELVKPSLKSPLYYHKKRSLSLPSTPTYKQVHFGGSTDVRYFHKKDRPAAISASNSPKLDPADDDDGYDYSDDDDDDGYDNDSCDSDPESIDFNNKSFGFDHHDEEKRQRQRHQGLHSRTDTKYPKKLEGLIDWQLKLTNFPPLSYLKKIENGTPVFLEKIFISGDRKYLLGHVAVQNLAFEKHITIRYSLDNWMTVIELPTNYIEERPEVLKLNDYDRFGFKIPLKSLFNSLKFSTNSSTDSLDASSNEDDGTGTHERTYQLCIKYETNNQEYWDNNGSKNYEVKLVRSFKQMPDVTKPFIRKNVGVVGTKIQEHARKPRYSNSYLKRVASDSAIATSMNSKSITESTAIEPATSGLESPSETSIVDSSSGSSNFSEISDFVKNNYYLSSPLLSSLHKSPDLSEDYFGQNSIKSPALTPENTSSAKYKTKFKPHLSKLDTSDFNRNFVDESLKSDHGKQPSQLEKEENQGLGIKSQQVNGKSDSHSSKSNKKQDSTGSKKKSSSLGPSFSGLSAANRTKFLNSKSYKELLENYCFFSSNTASGVDATITVGSNGQPRTNNNNNNNGGGSRNSSSSSNSSSESNNSKTSTNDGDENVKVARENSFTISSFLGT
ncbi:conserved hypothetical protein [Candida dubliniensis CD36]|uniref:CBM21 domain-containing protein n=1 Tax=Candida dubliniensis (strain CD36 / ATCC MYA-646 / CBS 7987 / NCPF 3949 / NRRL Y-17841) TaxID=573826 RepID=B9W6R3_CANDC|nr:conserved hypothetical protein [Candida dubliniensis CD36]CAX44368.1 conserved hypothetical protein [Candida dubliniensis CD36]